MQIREAAACALPLLLCLGCQVEGPDVDVTETRQAMTGDDYYDSLWDSAFEDKYKVASFTGMVVRTGGVPGGPVPADFYFPDVDAAANADAFPMVPVLQGGNVPKEQYGNFASKLASFGFVVVVPNLEQSFGPPGSPTLILTSQWVANWVEADLLARDADPASPLFSIVDTANMGLVGHSFGAGNLLSAVEGTCRIPFCFPFFPPFVYTQPASLNAAVAHGFVNCDPSGNGCFYPDTSRVPTMLVNGGLDDPGAPTNEAYDSFEEPKALVVLDGINHFGLTNDDLARPGGPNPEPNETKQKLSNKRTARWTALWFRMHLQGDPVATELIADSGGVEQATVTADL